MLTFRRSALAVAAVAGTCTFALAQNSVTLVLERTEDLFSLVRADQANDYFVGNGLCSIETDGTSQNWFVGGYFNNGGIPAGANWQVSVVKVEFDGLGGRSFRFIPTSRNNSVSESVAGGEGIVGMDFARFGTTGYLAVVSEIRNVQTYNRVRVYDVTSQLNPILVSPTTPPPFTNPPTTRIPTGPAWDWGPAGVAGGGFDYKSTAGAFTQDGLLDGPILAMAPFASGGPRGVDKERADFDNRSVADGLPSGYVYRFGFSGLLYNAPRLVPLSGSSADTTNTNWRDFDIHPGTGVMVGRGSNSVRVAERFGGTDPQTFNTTSAQYNLNYPDPQANPGATVNAQRCNILHGANGGDLVVWNDRQTAANGQSWSSVLKLNQLTPLSDPSPCPAVTLNIVNPDGSPVTIAADTSQDATSQIRTTNGVMDFAWIESEGKLLVLDGGSSYRVYVFSVNPQPSCRADFNGDGNINPDDLGDFITCYFTEPPCPSADFNHDSNTDPDDLGDFITVFFSGGCG